mgnify:CR=1 FL=1
MPIIRYAENSDWPFWSELDNHLAKSDFNVKVNLERGYTLVEDDVRIGMLHYSLLWDTIPFCALLHIADPYQKQGYGQMLMKHWESDMRSKGHGMVLTSTRVDEGAQHFYRKLGYSDCGARIRAAHGTIPVEANLADRPGKPPGAGRTRIGPCAAQALPFLMRT